MKFLLHPFRLRIQLHNILVKYHKYIVHFQLEITKSHLSGELKWWGVFLSFDRGRQSIYNEFLITPPAPLGGVKVEVKQSSPQSQQIYLYNQSECLVRGYYSTFKVGIPMMQVEQEAQWCVQKLTSTKCKHLLTSFWPWVHWFVCHEPSAWHWDNDPLFY